MDEATPPVAVEFTPEFKRNLRRLLRRYRNLRADLKPLIERLESGENPGDRVPGTGATTYKVRLPNSDARRGKSGGYRVIYYVQTHERTILLTLYSKSDQGDLSTAAIRRIVGVLEDR